MSLDLEGGPTDLTPLAKALRALAHERRLHLLRFLLRPRYVEEIATELGVARQTAQEHVDVLLDVGLLERLRGRRETGAVTEYAVAMQRLFALQESIAQLGGDPPPQELRRPTMRVGAPEEDAPHEPGPRLVLVKGRRIGREHRLAGAGPWMIGRDPSALLSLDYDPFVSNKHVEVRRAGSGFEVVDLYSSNGSFLDWIRLPRGEARPLENGAILMVGRTVLVFRDPPARRPPSNARPAGD